MGSGRVLRAASVVVVTAAVVLAPLSSAQAAPGDFSFAAPATTIYPYGTPWQLTAVAEGFSSVSNVGEISIKGTGYSHTQPVKLYFSRGSLSKYYEWKASLYGQGEYAYLPPGKYGISLRTEGNLGNTSGSIETGIAEITVVAAKLDTTVSVARDPSSQSNAIVGLTLGGEFVREVGGEAGHPLPAGTWDVAVNDQSGQGVFTRKLQVPERKTATTSLYLDELKPSMNYTVAASFTPESAHVADFDIAAAQAAKYASPQQAVVVSPTTPSNADVPSSGEVLPPSPFSVPAWLVGVLGIVVLALLAAIVVLTFRRRAGSAVTQPDPDLVTADSPTPDSTLPKPDAAEAGDHDDSA